MSQEKREAEKIRQGFKLFGYYQIVGGVIGLGLVGWLFTLAGSNPILIGALLVALALFTYSIYCGNLLLQQKEKGLLLSQINQGVQILQFALLGFSLEYVAGIGVLFGFDLSQDMLLLMNFSFSAFQVKFHASSEVYRVQINLVAIILIVLLEKFKEKVQAGKQLANV